MSENPPAGIYTPGYAWPKRLMALGGLALFVLGFWQIHTPLRLLAFGTRATAEALDVVKSKPGLPDLVLHDDAQVQAHAETHDRSYVFWNDFQFHTTDGQAVTVRAPVGSQLKPLYALLDPDGLPTTDVVYYDSHDPGTVVFPRIISTWFAPGAMAFVGLLAFMIGSVLLYWSDKPIVLPHVPSSNSAPEDGSEELSS